MEISKALVGLIVGASIAAGAGGAYLATRSSDAVSPPDDLVTPVEQVAAPVEQSEGFVAEAPVAVEPPPPVAPAPRASAPAPQPRPAVRQERREAPRAAERPALAAPQTAAAPPPVEEIPLAAPIEPPRIVDNQASRNVEPAGPIYDELVVAADSVIGLELETSLTSERARVEDQVVARVTRDVRVGDRVAIPAGSRAQGEVTLVERGGKVRERARLGVRFTSIVLADGTRVPIDTETIYREGDAPTGESAAKIGGGAIGGAIIGGILGGAKGAAIGGAVGAGGGTAAVLAGGRNPATLPSGTPVTVRIEDPVTVTVER
jgi:hypothetical protein